MAVQPSSLSPVRVFQMNGEINKSLSSFPQIIWEKIFPYLQHREQFMCLSVCRKWNKDLSPVHNISTLDSLNKLLQALLAIPQVSADPSLSTELISLSKEIEKSDHPLKSSFMRECLAPMLVTLMRTLARHSPDLLKEIDTKSLSIILNTIGRYRFQKLIDSLSHACNVCPALPEAESCEELLKLVRELNQIPFSPQNHLLSPSRRFITLALNEFGPLLQAIPMQMLSAYAALTDALRMQLNTKGSCTIDKLASVRSYSLLFPPNLIPFGIDLLINRLDAPDGSLSASYLLAVSLVDDVAHARKMRAGILQKVDALSSCPQKSASVALLIRAMVQTRVPDDLESVAQMAMKLEESDFSDDAHCAVSSWLIQCQKPDQHPNALDLAKKIKDPQKKLLILCKICLASPSEAQFQLLLKDLEEVVNNCRKSPIEILEAARVLQNCQMRMQHKSVERARSLAPLAAKLVPSVTSEQAAYESEESYLEEIELACALPDPTKKGTRLGELFLNYLDFDADLHFYIEKKMRLIADPVSRDLCCQACVQVLKDQLGCYLYEESIIFAQLLSSAKVRIAEYAQILQRAAKENHLSEDLMEEISRSYLNLGYPQEVRDQFWAELAQASLSNGNQSLALNFIEHVSNAALKERLISEIFSSADKT